MLNAVLEYCSPTMTTLALLSKEPDENGVIALIFNYIPTWKRPLLRLQIKRNFLVKTKKKVEVHFDRLIMPGEPLATGIRLVPRA